MTRLENLFGNMLTFLLKYFSEERIRKEVVTVGDTEFNFFMLRDELTIAIDTDADIPVLRKIAESGCIIYNKIIKDISAIPTTRVNWKKKMIQRLFSIAYEGNIDDLVEKLIKEFKETGKHKSKLNFYCFCLSKMKEYDLDCNQIIIGGARASKSTLLMHEILKVFGFRLKLSQRRTEEYLINRKFIETNVSFTANKDLTDLFKNTKEDMLSSDEGNETADRRESLNRKHNNLIKAINKYAYQNHIMTTVIQVLPDIDFRYINKANVIIIIVKRGRGLVFSLEKNFSSLIKDFFGFEYILKNPNLLNNFDKGLYNLKKLPSYVCEVKFKSLDGNKFYEIYKENKKKNELDPIAETKTIIRKGIMVYGNEQDIPYNQ